MSKKKTILLVEDDQAIRDMMKTLLEIEGYQVIPAANGKEGILALQETEAPSLIFLDMMMPIMNGWDFLDFVRTNALTSRIPIVVVSAYKEIAKSVSPQGFVPKPVQLNTLLEAVAQFAA